MYANAATPEDTLLAALADARALIVGIGALGCAAATALARAGVGQLTLVDDDLIESSNLQRQILFDAQSIGRAKAAVAANALAASTPTCNVVARLDHVDEANVDQHVATHDVIIDATDAPRTKDLLNRAAIRRHSPFVYGGVARTGGMAMAVDPEQSACLACAFPMSNVDEDAGCDRIGMLAPVAGVIGALQAYLALRTLCGDRSIAGTLFVYDLRGPRWRELRFSRERACAVCGDAAVRAA